MAGDNEVFHSGDIICRLLNVTKDELKKLVDQNAISKSGRDKYVLAVVIREYINHVRGADDKPASQAYLAAHLGMSERNIRDVLEKIKVDHLTSPVKDVRLKYCEMIRGVAAGHRAMDGSDLTQERVFTERIDRQLKELTLAEKLSELVPTEEVKPMIEQMVAAFRADIMSLADNLKTTIDATHGIDVDIELINEPIEDALQRLSSFEVDVGCDNQQHDQDGGTATENDDNGVGE